MPTEGRTELTEDQKTLIGIADGMHSTMNAFLDRLAVYQGTDKRLVALANTHFEVAHMILNKACAAPERLVAEKAG